MHESFSLNFVVFHYGSGEGTEASEWLEWTMNRDCTTKTNVGGGGGMLSRLVGG